jgi:UDP-N-acetylglucosamine acyltransferase
MPQIHPLALVEQGAQLAAEVVVGPFAYIGPNVKLGPRCVVHHHAAIEGDTIAGAGNHFFSHCNIGAVSQDLKYRGGRCQLVIGDNNRIRENVTIHIGTEDGGGVTRIGNDNLLMVNAHVAHDCIVGNNCIIANNVMLAGHIEVRDGAVLSGAVAVHHFVTIGEYSFIGGVSTVVHDVPPFMVVNGHPASVRGVNRVGLRRKGYTDKQMEQLKTAYKLLFKQSAPLSVQAAQVEQLFPENREIAALLTFIRRSDAGKFGRFRESLRGKIAWDPEDPANEF